MNFEQGSQGNLDIRDKLGGRQLENSRYLVCQVTCNPCFILKQLEFPRARSLKRMRLIRDDAERAGETTRHIYYPVESR